MHIVVLERDVTGPIRQDGGRFDLRFVPCLGVADAIALKTSSIEWVKCPIQAQIDQPGPEWEQWRSIT